MSRDDRAGAEATSQPVDAPSMPGFMDPNAPAISARRSRGWILSLAVGLIGLTSLGASAWVYIETQRALTRVATDIAGVRLSLELFAQQQNRQADADPTDQADAGADAETLRELSNRLAALETAAAAGPGTNNMDLPQLTGGLPPPVDTGDGDCLPVGTRFMVAAGDIYDVCGTSGNVAIASVDNGYITLGDGTIVASGGTVGLAGTQCMLGVVPSQGDGLSGYAEIRVVC